MPKNNIDALQAQIAAMQQQLAGLQAAPVVAGAGRRLADDARAAQAAQGAQQRATASEWASQVADHAAAKKMKAEQDAMYSQPTRAGSGGQLASQAAQLGAEQNAMYQQPTNAGGPWEAMRSSVLNSMSGPGVSDAERGQASQMAADQGAMYSQPPIAGAGVTDADRASVGQAVKPEDDPLAMIASMAKRRGT